MEEQFHFQLGTEAQCSWMVSPNGVGLFGQNIQVSLCYATLHRVVTCMTQDPAGNYHGGWASYMIIGIK